VMTMRLFTLRFFIFKDCWDVPSAV
jgi:hypothetical protein